MNDIDSEELMRDSGESPEVVQALRVIARALRNAHPNSYLRRSIRFWYMRDEQASHYDDLLPDLS